MMHGFFQVNRPVGAGHSRPNDVIRLRKALRRTGHGASPPEPSGAYDASVIASIERFQRDFGLKADGVVLPGGPTERALDMALAARQQGGPDAMGQMRDAFAALNDHGFVFVPTPRGDPRPGVFTDRGGRIVSPDKLRQALEAGGQARPAAEREGTRRGMKGLEDDAGERPEEKQVAFAPAIAAGLAEAAPYIAGILGITGGIVGGQTVIDTARKNGNQPAPPLPLPPAGKTQPVRRTMPADNIPRGPAPSPAEPPPDLKPEPERIPAEPTRPTILKGPEIEEARPGILIFPDLSGELDDGMIVEDRRGNERTRAGLEKVRDFFLDKVFGGDPNWILKAGGRDRETGAEKPEEWIPGPQKDFEPLLGRKIDGRKGGKFIDLTFENKATGEIVRVQTVDGDKNGKPTQRELDNADIIRKRERGKVFLIVKDAIPD